MTELFEKQDQTVPQSQRSQQKLPPVKQPTLQREVSTAVAPGKEYDGLGEEENAADRRAPKVEAIVEEASAVAHDVQPGLIEGFAGRDTRERTRGSNLSAGVRNSGEQLSKDKQKLVNKLSRSDNRIGGADEYDNHRYYPESDALRDGRSVPVLDFNKRVAEQQAASNDSRAEASSSPDDEEEETIPKFISTPIKPSPGVVQNAFDRMRPQRTPTQIATITIGDKTTTTVLGPTVSKRQKVIPSPRVAEPSTAASSQRFISSMRSFAAPGTQLETAEGFHHRPSQSEEPELSSRTDESPSVTPSGGMDTSANVALNKWDKQEEPDSEADEGESLGESEHLSNADLSDDDYVDEAEKKAREDAKDAALIQQAEEAAAIPSQDNVKRANKLLKGGGQKEATTQLIQLVEHSIQRINKALLVLRRNLNSVQTDAAVDTLTEAEAESPEERLSLKVSKEDFSRMHIIGQFNLGFILAVRPSHSPTTSDELFIIDQHASDEKYNFERLQATTVVQNQRLVHPHPLDLTAIEEEIILENNTALVRNGFLVDMDTTGDFPVGQRCKLVSLPMSREVTFDTTDLEELIALLAETGFSASAALDSIPRPIKVRKMFAMRACRSSVMIGKSLSMKQMERLVRKMGAIDKPWNCPHGRPTMRHVMGLGAWAGWEEGDGVIGLGGDEGGEKEVDWRGWITGASVVTADDDEGHMTNEYGVEMMEGEGNGEDEGDAQDDEEKEGGEEVTEHSHSDLGDGEANGEDEEDAQEEEEEEEGSEEVPEYSDNDMGAGGEEATGPSKLNLLGRFGSRG